MIKRHDYKGEVTLTAEVDKKAEGITVKKGGTIAEGKSEGKITIEAKDAKAMPK